MCTIGASKTLVFSVKSSDVKTPSPSLRGHFVSFLKACSLRPVKFVAEGMGVHTKTREERLANRTCSTDSKFCAATCLH